MRCCCLWNYGAVLGERKVETMKDLFIGKWKLKLTFLYLSFKLGFKYSRLICYVTNSKALPPPLSSDEENELLERLRAGEDEVRGTLIERNLRLVVYIARKFENTGVAVDDLVSIGTIGLIKAVNTFDPHKKIKLATYASKCIENEILMYLRRNNKLKVEISFDEPLNVDWEGNKLLLSDILGTDSDQIYKDMETNVEKSTLKELFSRLNARDRAIICMRYGLYGAQEKTQKEIADMMNISQSYISRLEKKIVDKLREEFIEKTMSEN